MPRTSPGLARKEAIQSRRHGTTTELTRAPERSWRSAANAGRSPELCCPNEAGPTAPAVAAVRIAAAERTSAAETGIAREGVGRCFASVVPTASDSTNLQYCNKPLFRRNPKARPVPKVVKRPVVLVSRSVNINPEIGPSASGREAGHRW